jgi:hypothetical protein
MGWFSKKTTDDDFQPEDDPDIKALMDMGILAIEGERKGLDTRLTLTPFGRVIGQAQPDKKNKK